MFYVYTIKNANDRIYIGHTSNLTDRLKRHNGELKNKNKSFTSKNKGPWELVYSEVLNTRQEAIIREKQLKSARGRKFIKEVIKK